MPLTLTWTDQTNLAVNCQALSPDRLTGLSVRQVEHLPVLVGNETKCLADLFRVEGELDGALELFGDLSHVRGIGEKLEVGSIVVRGNAGPCLGMQMSGGSIEVEGDADVWAGAEMSGGTLNIRGSAGDYLGAAFPGSRKGMKDGIILVHGNAGDDVGLSMRRGLIAVQGSVGSGFGRAMIAGTLVAWGAAGLGVGSGMKRGTIALAGVSEDELLPTFSFAGSYRPPVWSIYAMKLSRMGFEVTPRAVEGVPVRYNGDLASGGQGEVLLWN